MDHVANYRPPKDSDDIDDVTKTLREQGCAPKLSSSESEEEDDYAVPMKKPKKGLTSCCCFFSPQRKILMCNAVGFLF